MLDMLTTFHAVMGAAKSKVEVLNTLRSGGEMWVDDAARYGKNYPITVDDAKAAGLEHVRISYGAGFRYRLMVRLADLAVVPLV